MVSGCTTVPHAIPSMCRRHGKGPYDRRCDLRSTLKYGPVFPPFERACWRYSVSSTTYALVHALSYAVFLFFRIVVAHLTWEGDGSRTTVTYGRNKLRPSRVNASPVSAAFGRHAPGRRGYFVRHPSLRSEAKSHIHSTPRL